MADYVLFSFPARYFLLVQLINGRSIALQLLDEGSRSRARDGAFLVLPLAIGIDNDSVRLLYVVVAFCNFQSFTLFRATFF
jgi:hypothetical protein